MTHFWYYIQLVFAITLAAFATWFVTMVEVKPEKPLSYICAFSLTVIATGSAGALAYNSIQKIIKSK